MSLSVNYVAKRHSYSYYIFRTVRESLKELEIQESEMNEELYETLVLYLQSRKFPETYTQKTKRILSEGKANPFHLRMVSFSIKM